MRYFIFLMLFARPAVAASIDLKHYIRLSWTTQTVKLDGGLSPGFSLFSLSCVLRECTLIEARLNGCYGKGPDAFFMPELHSWSTLDGNLKIHIEDSDIGVSYETAGGWSHRHRFGVKIDKFSLMTIVSYVGGAMHDVRPQAVTYAIVPEGTKRGFDCKAQLPGLSADSPAAQQKPSRKTP